ncbi:hypothetical protein C8F01DRAFT_1005926, partial [Mycena amicta]
DAAVHAREAEALKTFNTKLAELRINHCTSCREEGFHLKMKTAATCARCFSTRSETALWSDENRTNPMPAQGLPPELRYLTDMEEMLIARTKTVMQVRWTTGRQLSYKDHIVRTPSPRHPTCTHICCVPDAVLG